MQALFPGCELGPATSFVVCEVSFHVCASRDIYVQGNLNVCALAAALLGMHHPFPRNCPEVRLLEALSECDGLKGLQISHIPPRIFGLATCEQGRQLKRFRSMHSCEKKMQTTCEANASDGAFNLSNTLLILRHPSSWLCLAVTIWLVAQAILPEDYADGASVWELRASESSVLAPQSWLPQVF